MSPLGETPSKDEIAAALEILREEPAPLFRVVLNEWQNSSHERLGAIAYETEDDILNPENLMICSRT